MKHDVYVMYHGKEVFVYSYEVLLDMNRNNAIYKHFKIEKILDFVHCFNYYVFIFLA